MRWLVLVPLVAACMPSRSALFDPVAASVRERTGISPEWRTGWRRSAAVDARVKEVLGKPLTAEDAALLAVLVSPELQAAYAELGVVGGTYASARTFSNPEIEAEIVFPLEEGSTQLELTAVQDVTQLLTLLGRASGANAALKGERRAAVAMTIDVAARARVAFYEAAAAEQILRLRRTVSEAADASAAVAKSLHEAGNVTDFDFTRETLFAEDARLEVAEAEANAAAARERLNAVIGLTGDETGWTLAASPLADAPATIADVSSLERDAIAASLDLDAARWRIEAAGQEIGVARLRSVLPTLGVGVSVEREEGWSVGPAVTLSLPLWDWGQGARGAAWARLYGQQHRYTATAIAIRSAARAVAARLVSAHRRASTMKGVVLPLRERLAEQAILQYNAMQIDVFELILIRREHIEAEERYVRAVRDYWIAQTETDQLRAGSLPRGAFAETDDEADDPARVEAPEDE